MRDHPYIPTLIGLSHNHMVGHELWTQLRWSWVQESVRCYISTFSSSHLTSHPRATAHFLIWFSCARHQQQLDYDSNFCPTASPQLPALSANLLPLPPRTMALSEPEVECPHCHVMFKRSGSGNCKGVWKGKHKAQEQEQRYIANLLAQPQCTFYTLMMGIHTINVGSGSAPPPKFITPWERVTGTAQLLADGPSICECSLLPVVWLIDHLLQQHTLTALALSWIIIWLRVIRKTTSRLNTIRIVVAKLKFSKSMNTFNCFQVLTRSPNLNYGHHFTCGKTLSLQRLFLRLEWHKHR